MRSFGVTLVVLLLLGSSGLSQDIRSTEHQEGLRSNRPTSVVLTNAKVFIAPGRALDKAMIFIRNGKIESVRKSGSSIPPAYREVNLEGKTVYAGLIDAYTETEVSDAPLDLGAPYWNSNIRAQLSVAKHSELDSGLSQSLRKNGVTARLAVPAGGIIKGNSALLLTGDGDLQANLIKANVGQHARLTVQRRFRSSTSRTNRPSYPNSPMGAVALARQALYDAQWYKDAGERVTAKPNLPQPEPNDSLVALSPVIDRKQAMIIDSSNELYFLRAHRFANEFNLKAIIKGSGFEFRRLDDIAKTGRPILLPVNFPTAPNVASFESALNVTLETLMEWDHAPENPARLANAGVEFAFCSAGLEDKSDFLKNVRKSVERGLSKEVALKALTVTPAKLFGVSELFGKIEKGQFANLLITDGDLFDSETKILETWIAGTRYREPEPKLQLTGSWKLTTKDDKGRPVEYSVQMKSSPKSTSGSIAKVESNKKKSKNKNKNKKDEVDKDVKFSKIGIQNNRLSAVYDSQQLGGANGLARFTFIFSESFDSAEGFVTLPSGVRIPATLMRVKESATEATSQGIKKESSRKKLGSEKVIKTKSARMRMILSKRRAMI